MTVRGTDLLDELATAHGDEVVALATLVIQHRAGAEAAVMDALVDAASHPERLPPPGPARRRFVLRIARRRVLAADRRSSTIDPVLELHGGHSAGPHGPGHGPIAPRDVAGAMARLPARLRALVALRLALDLDDEELAEAMELEPATAARLADDAIQRLRARLDGAGAPEIEEIVDAD